MLGLVLLPASFVTGKNVYKMSYFLTKSTTIFKLFAELSLPEHRVNFVFADRSLFHATNNFGLFCVKTLIYRKRSKRALTKEDVKQFVVQPRLEDTRTLK